MSSLLSLFLFLRSCDCLSFFISSRNSLIMFRNSRSVDDDDDDDDGETAGTCTADVEGAVDGTWGERDQTVWEPTLGLVSLARTLA